MKKICQRLLLLFFILLCTACSSGQAQQPAPTPGQPTPPARPSPSPATPTSTPALPPPAISATPTLLPVTPVEIPAPEQGTVWTVYYDDTLERAATGSPFVISPDPAGNIWFKGYHGVSRLGQ